jgi:ABC-2 type transport system ATP-binding protein
MGTGHPSGGSDSPVVLVRDLAKRFGGTLAIETLSLSVQPGEIVGLLGTNGAGKTTAIHILLGIVKRSAGTVEIFGLDPERHRAEVLGQCNFCSAYAALPGNLKVIENLRVFAHLYNVRNGRARINELLERFEITELRNRITGELSAGEATRVNICKALLNAPRLLLLDEPTASLDPDIADKTRHLLRALRSETGMSMIYTSHNMRDVEVVCDRIIFMRKGRSLAEGAPAEILERFGRKTLEEVFIQVARGQETDGGAP